MDEKVIGNSVVKNNIKVKDALRVAGAWMKGEGWLILLEIMITVNVATTVKSVV